MEVEWVEVQGRTVEIAVAAALDELGLSDRAMADVEIIEEGTKGTLGFGKKDAVVRVKPRQQQKKRRKRTRRPKDGPSGTNRSGRQTGSGPRSDEQTPSRQAPRPARSEKSKPEPETKEQAVDRDEQAVVVSDFLKGLLDSFGLEGEVNVGVEDDAVVAQVHGDQTEALVGERAAILQSVLELTRTVVQRQTHDGVRIRLDIAGYRERRREALGIYAGRLSEQVVSEGAELQLEPMNAADRKVIHDAIGEIAGVRSYSEGEEPRRFVVLGPDEASS